MFRMACGRMIVVIVIRYGIPSDRPASIWPIGIDSMPARMISAT